MLRRSTSSFAYFFGSGWIELVKNSTLKLLEFFVLIRLINVTHLEKDFIEASTAKLETDRMFFGMLVERI